jgi:hypothetical protein
MIVDWSIGRGLGAVACCLCIAATGCKVPPPPPAERVGYTDVLDKYYEGRPMCLWPQTVKFPVEDATPQLAAELGLPGLEDAGLLVVKPVRKGAAAGTKDYDLTPEGRTALDPDVFQQGAGNFCYGRRKVVSIDAARRNSSTTELVDYHYRVPQPAAWANEVAIQRAFPQVAAELGSTHMAEATLLDTTGGWEISGTPATVAPPAGPPQHTSALAQAKRLLLHK